AELTAPCEISSVAALMATEWVDACSDTLFISFTVSFVVLKFRSILSTIPLIFFSIVSTAILSERISSLEDGIFTSWFKFPSAALEATFSKFCKGLVIILAAKYAKIPDQTIPNNRVKMTNQCCGMFQNGVMKS